MILDAASPLERVRLSGELGKALGSLKSAADPMAKIKAAAQVRDLLARLGVKAAPAAPALRIDPADKAGSLASIRSYLEGGISELNPAFSNLEMGMLGKLAYSLGDLVLASEIIDVSNSGTDESNLSAFSAVSSRGVSVDFDRDAALARIASKADAQKQYDLQKAKLYADGNAEIQGLGFTYRKQVDRLNAQMREAVSSFGSDSDEARSVRAASDEAWKTYKTAYDMRSEKLKADVSALLKPEFSEEDAEADREIGRSAIEAVMAASKVTHEQAKDWASRQLIDADAQKRLTKEGYSIDSLRSDMADFYRMTGGKIAEIEVSAAKSGRAHAAGISSSTGRKTVAIGTKFNRRVLFHELAHHLEADDIAKAAANGYLAKRRESSRTYSLKSLTGMNYGKDERAYKDDFLNPYMGKVYPDGATEVFALGVDYLSDPDRAGLLVAKDPELFSLISGYISHDMTPAMQGLVALHTGATVMRRAEEADIEDKHGPALQRLAATVNLTPDLGWMAREAEVGSRALRNVIRASKRGTAPALIGGTEDGYRVFSGTFTSRKSNRHAKGLLVTLGDGDYPNYSTVHTGLDDAKALIALSRQSGLLLSKTWVQFFYQPRGRKLLIEAASGIEP